MRVKDARVEVSAAKMTSSNAIASCVFDWYNRQKWKAPQGKNWSVIAGIVLERDSAYTLIAVGTGTKCVGANKMNPSGLVVHDSHAEVIARRALMRYFYLELLDAERRSSKTKTTHPNSIFSFEPQLGIYSLKKDCRLHLYISESPCGDASLYSLTSESLEALERPPKKRKFTTTNTMRITGAKLVQAKEEARFQQQQVGALRVKSGRSDLKQQDRTHSMSCSDKILRWNMLGVQGTLLSKWLAPVYFSSVVCSSDQDAQAADVLKALERGCWARRRPKSLSRCTFHLTELSFIDSRPRMQDQMNGSRCSALSYNWSRSEKYWDLKHFPRLSKQFRAPEIEATVGAHGRRMGTNVKSAASVATSSRLCRYQLFQAFCALEKSSTDAYEVVKRSQEHTTRKLQVLESHLQGWHQHSSAYNNFRLDI